MKFNNENRNMKISKIVNQKVNKQRHQLNYYVQLRTQEEVLHISCITCVRTCIQCFLYILTYTSSCARLEHSKNNFVYLRLFSIDCGEH